MTESKAERKERLLTPQEVGRLLRITPSAVLRAAKKGRLPGVCVLGGVLRRRTRFKRSEIEKLLARRQKA